MNKTPAQLLSEILLRGRGIPIDVKSTARVISHSEIAAIKKDVNWNEEQMKRVTIIKDFIGRSPGATAIQIRRSLGLKESTVLRHLKEMSDKDIVTRNKLKSTGGRPEYIYYIKTTKELT